MYSEMYDSKTNLYNKLEFSIGLIRSFNMKNSKQHTTLWLHSVEFRFNDNTCWWYSYVKPITSSNNISWHILEFSTSNEKKDLFQGFLSSSRHTLAKSWFYKKDIIQLEVCKLKIQHIFILVRIKYILCVKYIFMQNIYILS